MTIKMFKPRFIYYVVDFHSNVNKTHFIYISSYNFCNS